MRLHINHAVAALLLGGWLAAPAQSAPKPKIAIMPAQYYSADAKSAQKITESLRAVYERQGYEVLPASRAAKTFQAMGLRRGRHYPDWVPASFGRKMGADLVAYPRLLTIGLPMSETPPPELQPEAVLHLRVVNAHTRQAIYFRQVAHPFESGSSTLAGDYTLPRNAASRTAAKAASVYFERVAGSRQEIRGRR